MAEAKPSYAVALARELLARGRCDEAAAAFELAIRSSPDDPDLYLGLGEATASVDRADAERMLRRVVELAPQRAEAHDLLGQVLSSPRDSELCFRRAIEREPAVASYRCNLAVSLLRQDDGAAAERCLREALAIAPGHLPAITMLGELVLDAGRAADAAAIFGGAIAEIDPGAERHREAWARYDRGDYEGAEALLVPAPGGADDEALGWIFGGLGRARTALGEHATAAAAFRSAIRRLPRTATLHRALGDALAAQGLVLKAAAAHERARQLEDG